jgi:hypothetical protein
LRVQHKFEVLHGEQRPLSRAAQHVALGLRALGNVRPVAARDWLGQIEEMAEAPEEGRRALGPSYAQEYRAIALERKAA